MSKIKTTGLLIIPICFLIATLPGCGHFTIGPEPEDDKISVFKAFWDEMDKHYVFFDIKDIDWGQVYEDGIQELQLNPNMSDFEMGYFYNGILEPFYDGHLWIDTHEDEINISSYSRWFEATELEKENSLYFDIFDLADKYLQAAKVGCDGTVLYGNIDSTTGYMWIVDFFGQFDQNDVDEVFKELSKFDRLIIDVRSNTGGYLKKMNLIASKLVRERLVYGYQQTKSGPGHFNFSELKPLVIEPDGMFKYEGKVIILIDAYTQSAAEYLTLAMKINKCPIIGERTAGSTGAMIFKELPNGWILFYPCTRLFNLDKQLLENVGIRPDIAVKADPDSVEIYSDETLEEALRMLR